MSKTLDEFTVTATPVDKAIEPFAASRTSSGAAPVAVAVAIGVVRAVEITVSAQAPEATTIGAIATAVASSARIRNKPLEASQSSGRKLHV